MNQALFYEKLYEELLDNSIDSRELGPANVSNIPNERANALVSEAGLHLVPISKKRSVTERPLKMSTNAIAVSAKHQKVKVHLLRLS